MEVYPLPSHWRSCCFSIPQNLSLILPKPEIINLKRSFLLICVLQKTTGGATEGLQPLWVPGATGGLQPYGAQAERHMMPWRHHMRSIRTSFLCLISFCGFVSKHRTFRKKEIMPITSNLQKEQYCLLALKRCDGGYPSWHAVNLWINFAKDVYGSPVR